ncbi:hypothetical protein BH09VER1_BH09VER1_40040 [soil metagenome]
MPRNQHSSRSRNNFRIQPETPEKVIRPPQKFPVLYISLIGGGLALASLAVTVSFLLSGPVKPATTKLGNQPRTDLAPPLATPPAAEGSNPSPATPSSAPSVADSQPFLLRPGNGDSGESASASSGLDSEDVQRKVSLAEMEFRAKNYAEAERIFREILPDAARQPLTIYQIYTCLLLQEKRDAAADFLSQTGLNSEPPVLYYCKATQALISGDKSTAQEALAEAHRRFPDLCASYDPTLKILGYLP